MVAFSRRRRCVLALLCAALVLASVCARAKSIVVSGDVTETGDAFDGDSITFSLDSVTANVVTVQLTSSTVSGSGLSIKGYSGTVPAGVTTRVSMGMAATTVTSATIAFSGVMPSNSDIRLVSTTGTLTAAQSLFDFSGLTLSGNVTLMVEDSAVTWPSSSTNTGSVVTYSNGATAVGISDNSALFILNATATNGASVLHIATSSSFGVKDSAVLAIDYGRCEACSAAMVAIDVPLVVDSSSMFRISHGTVVQGTGGLLSSAGSVTVSGSSLYLISDSAIESGSLFSYDSSADSATPAAFSFTVSGSSTVSFLNLVAPSTGLSSTYPVPSDVDATSTVNGGSCVIDGKSLTSVSDYAAIGITVAVVVDSNGAATTGSNAGSCANANCVPGHSSATSTADSEGVCSCSCTGATYPQPSCSSISDPTASYVPSSATCSVPNCGTCDRLYPTSRCSSCATGYRIGDNHECVLNTTATDSSSSSDSSTATDNSTATANTTSTTTTTTTTTALCRVSYCSRCNPTNGNYCATCSGKYKLSGGRCVANTNGAAALQSAVLAAAVCAVAVYVL